MKNPKHSLRKIVTFLNNPDEDGGFWLPNIQRSFVWTEDQICRLFDSILRAYPISTLLIWKTKSPVRMRGFIDNWHDNLRMSDFHKTVSESKKCLVLDGQQRLQSLFIGLKGSYNGRELHFDITSGRSALPDDVKFQFTFLETSQAKFPWLRFKDLVYSGRTYPQETKYIVENAGRKLTDDEESRVADNVSHVKETFADDDGISYQELDSIEKADVYREEDVVEIFIRANSGGTKLGKSDLMFALLVAGWDDAGKRLEELLQELNASGFAFERDLILKTCLTLQGLTASYNVERFRTPDVKEWIEQNWDRISDSFKAVLDFIRQRTFIQGDRAMLSYLAIIPLVYARFHFPKTWKRLKGVDIYLLRTLLCRVFGGHADLTVNACIAAIRDANGFDVDSVFAAIRNVNKPLELQEETFFSIGYGNKAMHLIFNLWYREFNYTPASPGNFPQIDHIFAESALRRLREGNALKYPKEVRDQIANCMLLTTDENGPGGKGDKTPDEWFADKDDAYLNMHLIPRDKTLWKVERFTDFLAARKQLIREKFADYIASVSRAAPPAT